MKTFEIKLTNKNYLKASIENEELVYGVTAIAINKNSANNDFNFLKNPSNLEEIFAIHPLTNEQIPIVFIDENLKFDAELIIPAHNKKHFEHAKQFNLPIKQVVAPYFKGTGEQELKQEIETVFRRSVVAVIKNPKNNKYLCVDSLSHPCKSFVMGGIEKDETPEDATLREVEEETGYCDVKITRTSIFTLHNHFYAQYKGVNRYAHLNVVFGELLSEKQHKLSNEELNKQTYLWLTKEELKEFLSVKNNIFIYENLLENDKAFEEDGIMINSFELNGKLKSEVKNYIKWK